MGNCFFGIKFGKFMYPILPYPYLASLDVHKLAHGFGKWKAKGTEFEGT